MSAKYAVLGVLLVILAIVYGCFIIGGSSNQRMQIMVSRRPGQPLPTGSSPSQATVDQVTFGFNSNYRFTSVKVVRADELATNESPYALWHLIAKEESAPTKVITYGEAIAGMEPALTGSVPDPLEPNVQYTLQVEANSGRIKTQTNFFTVASRRRPLL